MSKKLICIFIFLMLIIGKTFPQNNLVNTRWEGNTDSRHFALEFGDSSFRFIKSAYNSPIGPRPQQIEVGTYIIRGEIILLESDVSYRAILFGGTLSLQGPLGFSLELHRVQSGNNPQINTQNLPSFTLTNRTGYTIRALYIISSSSTSDSFGSNILTGTLSNGQSTTVRLSQSLNSVNRYDIRIVDTDGDSYTKWNILITNNGTVVFTFDDFD